MRKAATDTLRSPVRRAKPRMRDRCLRLQLARCAHPFAEQNAGCLPVGSDLLPTDSFPIRPILMTCHSDDEHLVGID
jgi:hypothetical protein